MALYAINMAEVAGNLLTLNELNVIYITSALRVKRSFPKYLKFFSRYFISRAKIENDKIHDNVKDTNWIFTTCGYRYFITHDFDFVATDTDNNHNTILFGQLNNSSDPISHVVKVN